MKRVKNQRNFFLDLCKVNSNIKKLEINNKEIDNSVEINKGLKKGFLKII